MSSSSFLKNASDGAKDASGIPASKNTSSSSTTTVPIIESFAVPPLGCNCTIIGDPISNDCICIDPGGNVHVILNKIRNHGWTLKRVLLTHGHLDHILGSKQLKEQTGCDILLHQDDLTLYEQVNEQCKDFGISIPDYKLPRPDEFVTDNMVIQWSPSYTIECLHCPGHTPGSISYYFPECQLVCPGDTLFQGSIGRTNWSGIPSLQGTSDPQQLLGSIQYKLFHLPSTTKVISGHGESTTIGQEQEYNLHVRRR